MRYSTKVSHAVHILAYIALHPGCVLTSDVIADSIQTNPGCVRQIMSALRKADLLSSVKGRPGHPWQETLPPSRFWIFTGLWRETSRCSTPTPILTRAATSALTSSWLSGTVLTGYRKRQNRRCRTSHCRKFSTNMRNGTRPIMGPAHRRPLQRNDIKKEMHLI